MSVGSVSSFAARADASECNRCAAGSLSSAVELLSTSYSVLERPITGKVIFPGKQWESWSSSEEAGIFSTAIEKAKSILQGIDTTSMVVVKGGKIAWTYKDPIDMDCTASMRKSVLAMLFGKYIENETISLTATLQELDFDDVGGLTLHEKQAQVIDLIAARSGIYHPASNVGDDSSDAPRRNTQTHGTYFLYNNWDFNAAGAIFEKLTGKNIYDALQQDLANPIGMEDYDRSIQHKTGDTRRSLYPAYDMWLSTRDLARLGHLMLHKGRWEDNQLIPMAWAELITTVITPIAEINSTKIKQEGLFEFGLMWWVWRNDPNRPWLKGAYTARGTHGQYMSVFPALDVVVAHKTSVNPEAKGAWDKYLLDHKQEPPERNGVSMDAYMQVLDALFGK